MKRIMLVILSLFFLFGCMETTDYKEIAKNMELPKNIELKGRTLHNMDEVVSYMIFRLYDGYININDISDKTIWKKTGKLDDSTDIIEATYSEAKVRIFFIKTGDMYAASIVDLLAQKGGKKYSGYDLLQEIIDIEYEKEMEKIYDQSEKEYNKLIEKIK